MKQALEALAYHTEQTRPIERTQLAIEALHAALAQPIPHIWADETPPAFARRWRLADDGFGMQRDDAGRYVDIDAALSVLHASKQPAQPAREYMFNVK